MGHFLAVTAIKTGSVDEAVAGLTMYMEAHALPCEWVRENAVNERRDAQVYAPVGGWTVILWPPYFNVHDFPLAREVAAARTGTYYLIISNQQTSDAGRARTVHWALAYGFR